MLASGQSTPGVVDTNFWPLRVGLRILIELPLWPSQEQACAASGGQHPRDAVSLAGKPLGNIQEEQLMRLTFRQYGIVALALVTALLHLAAAFDTALFPHGPDPLFILNGLGFLGLLGAYFLPIAFFQQRQSLVRNILMGYAVLTIVAWIWIWVVQYVIIEGTPFFSHDSVYGVPAKLAELGLIILLRGDRE